MVKYWPLWIGLSLFASFTGIYNGLTFGWTEVRLILFIGGAATALAWAWLVFDDRT